MADSSTVEHGKESINQNAPVTNNAAPSTVLKRRWDTLPLSRGFTSNPGQPAMLQAT